MRYNKFERLCTRVLNKMMYSNLLTKVELNVKEDKRKFHNSSILREKLFRTIM